MSKLIDLTGLSRFLNNLKSRFLGKTSGELQYNDILKIYGSGTGILGVYDGMSSNVCTLLIKHLADEISSFSVLCAQGTVPNSFKAIIDEDMHINYMWNDSGGDVYTYTFVPISGDIYVNKGTFPDSVSYTELSIPTIATSEDVGGIESALDAILYSNNTAIEQSLSNI